MRLHILTLALALAVANPPALGAGGGSRGSYSTGSHGKAASVQRNSHGRSEQAMGQFKKSHPCPSTGRSSGACPGYVIDHVTPLKRGGADAPSNMQWQTKEDAKRKDRWE